VEPRSESFLVSEFGPRLHSLHWGDRERPPLVLLHGGGANAHWWDHIAPAFAERFHVVALDFRGHGDSDRPRELIAGAFRADLAALLIELGNRPATLVGHSMGAHVALDHATSFPPAALILLDPSRGGDKRHSRRLRLALSLGQNYASREDAVERYRFLPDSEHASEALRHSIAEHSVSQNSDGRWGYKFDARWFGVPGGTRPDPGCVPCPTLVVRGAESAILSAENARTLCNELPRGELVTLDRAGHHVQIDRPDALIRAIHDFLDRHISAIAVS
jgi:pimeloyl-ACP methyl ester carboxylesterase